MPAAPSTVAAVTDSLADLLSRASTRPTDEPGWDPDAAPDEPYALLREWLEAAVDAHVLAANTVVLATATADGTPSARTVLLSDAIEDASKQVADGAVDPDWTAYLVAPAEIEFWQSRHGEGELRLRYRRAEGVWTRERLWP